MSRTDPRPHYGRGWRVRVDGYVDVWEPDHPLARSDGYVAEHRKVAWDAEILTHVDDHVHHINGIKTDNRPENLEAIDAATHQRNHHAADGGWAAENAAKQACPKCGGEYSTDARGRRYCRPCYLEYQRNYSRKRRRLKARRSA